MENKSLKEILVKRSEQGVQNKKDNAATFWFKNKAKVIKEMGINADNGCFYYNWRIPFFDIEPIKFTISDLHEAIKEDLKNEEICIVLKTIEWAEPYIFEFSWR